jgi:hypothetical protein
MKRWLLSGLSLGLLLAWSPLAQGNGAPPPRPQGGPGVGPGGGPPGGGFGALGGPGIGGGPALVPQKVKFSLEVDEKAKEARLIVPLGVMLQGFGFPGGIGIPPGGGIGGVPPGGGIGGFSPPGGVPPGINPPGGANPPGGQPPQKPGKLPGGVGQLHLPTIVAALALTMALASGGFWLVRRGSGRTLVGLLVVAGFALGATALWADIGPGPRPRPPVRAPGFKEPAKGTPVTLPADVQITSNKITFELSPANDNTVRLIVPKDAVKKGGEGSDKKEEKKPARDE